MWLFVLIYGLILFLIGVWVGAETRQGKVVAAGIVGLIGALAAAYPGVVQFFQGLF